MNESNRLTNEITQLTNQVSYLEQKISSLDANIVTLTEAICELNGIQRGLSGAIDSLRHQIGKMNAGMQYETKDYLYRTNHGGDVVGPDVDSAMEHVKKLTGSSEVKDGQ